MISLRDHILQVSEQFGPLNYAELESLLGHTSSLSEMARGQGQGPYIDALLRFAKDGSLPNAEVPLAGARKTRAARRSSKPNGSPKPGDTNPTNTTHDQKGRYAEVA